MDDLSNEDREYLRKLLSAAQKELLHELHHAAKQDFKESLKRELELNERVFAKLERVLAARM
jgi:uncharacterized membrane protein